MLDAIKRASHLCAETGVSAIYLKDSIQNNLTVLSTESCSRDYEGNGEDESAVGELEFLADCYIYCSFFPSNNYISIIILVATM